MSKNKKFFFEKKNQKTSAPLREVLKPRGIEIIEVFLLLFVHKKQVFLPLSSYSDRVFFSAGWELPLFSNSFYLRSLLLAAF
jgi:hypothetical protein